MNMNKTKEFKIVPEPTIIQIGLLITEIAKNKGVRISHLSKKDFMEPNIVFPKGVSEKMAEFLISNPQRYLSFDGKKATIVKVDGE